MKYKNASNTLCSHLSPTPLPRPLLKVFFQGNANLAVHLSIFFSPLPHRYRIHVTLHIIFICPSSQPFLGFLLP